MPLISLRFFVSRRQYERTRSLFHRIHVSFLSPNDSFPDHMSAIEGTGGRGGNGKAPRIFRKWPVLRRS